MALHLEGLAALVKSFVPSFSRAAPPDGPTIDPVAIEIASCDRAPLAHPMSADTEAALAALELPPDGPLDTSSVPRAKLPPELAATKFVQWVRALDLVGCYPRRSIIALYREFSEVDHRRPIGNVQLLEVLDRTDGVRKERLCLVSGRTKFGLEWQWIIDPAQAIQLLGEATPAVLELAAEALVEVDGSPAVEPPPAPSRLERKPARHTPMLLRFPIDEHPFSPSGLREHAKHARRARLNATASRKQRGARRRAH